MDWTDKAHPSCSRHHAQAKRLHLFFGTLSFCLFFGLFSVVSFACVALVSLAIASPPTLGGVGLVSPPVLCCFLYFVCHLCLCRVPGHGCDLGLCLCLSRPLPCDVLRELFVNDLPSIPFCAFTWKCGYFSKQVSL